MTSKRLNAITLRPGTQYDLSGLIAPGYITASGNYVDFCLPIRNDGVSSITTATIGSLIVLPSGGRLENAINTSTLPTIQTASGINHLVIELKLKTTQTANLPVNILFTSGSTITFS